jgi:ectoine hydroxylase-related dioxygenase (phytanoyl-CoA dioxygenase family)
VQRGSKDFPLVGFIFMVDAFTADNGATRLVPGTHKWRRTPEDSMQDTTADYGGQELACAPAGSLLIFNASTWHGHTANRTDHPRRSLQGAFVPLTGQAETDFTARMTAATRKRLGPAAQFVLGLR